MRPLERRRIAELLAVGILLAGGKRRRAYARADRAIRARRVTTGQLSSLYVHLSLLLGVPTALDALNALAASGHRPVLAPRSGGAAAGLRTFRRVYGPQSEPVLRALGTLHPFVRAWIIRDVYGAVFSRNGLSLTAKEIVTASVLAHQGLALQARSHVRGARRQGVSTTDIRRFLRGAARVAGRSPSAFMSYV